MKKILAAAACAASLAACSPVPAPQFMPPSSEQVLISAAHWDAIAADFASVLAPHVMGEASVVRPRPATAFSEAFGNMLSSELVSRHVSLVQWRDMAPVHVRYSVELVQHGYAQIDHRHGMERLHGGTPVWVRHDGAGVVPPDFPNSGPITEIVLTGAVERGGHELESVTRTYYVRGTDAANYLPPPPPPAPLPPPPAVSQVPAPPAGRFLVIDRYGERTLMLSNPLR